MLQIHDHHVIHRDLKPENVLLLDRRGGLLDLRIADFGEARRLRPGEKVNGRAGTRGYMAPEVLAEWEYAHAADVWSLGVILFTLLCGSLPFNHESEADEEAAVRAGHWSFADRNWEEVSDEAKEVVCQLLRQAPHQRPKVRPPSLTLSYSTLETQMRSSSGPQRLSHRHMRCSTYHGWRSASVQVPTYARPPPVATLWPVPPWSIHPTANLNATPRYRAARRSSS